MPGPDQQLTVPTASQPIGMHRLEWSRISEILGSCMPSRAPHAALGGSPAARQQAAGKSGNCSQTDQVTVPEQNRLPVAFWWDEQHKANGGQLS
jgi:hypothetical protein